jgi:acetyl esterase/lipase
VSLHETITERSADRSNPDRFVTGVSRPTLTPFFPEHPNGASLIVAAGGGYVREVMDHEGFETARWFAEHGVTAFYLKYRLPSDPHTHAADVPLQDAQRAVRLVRSRAAEWRLDPVRVGIIGFSAGGHLAASLADHFGDVTRAPLDRVDSLSARPDYVLLLYPVISMHDGMAHAGSKRALLGEKPTPEAVAAYSTEDHVTATTPPTFVALAADDKSVSPDNAIAYHRALRSAGVRSELHVYTAGGHGFGIGRAVGHPCAGWTGLAYDWLAALGVVPARTSSDLR